LVFILYELARHPDQAEKLYRELSTTDVTDHTSLRSLPYLNGYIKETLRLHPAIPSGGYRETPSSGVTIAGTYIPGGTTLVAPKYTIGRLESCFVEADSFIPERWYEKPDMIRNKKAFMPFSQGRYSCVGKNVALAELRYITAMLVSKYQIQFSEGEKGDRVEGKMRDQMTASPGQLSLIFRKRC
jgi:tryprostatin B 6-hydroxylase